ncbi:MAG: helix-turn-helix transcriptional regulator, partial [Bacteroidales bacterium]|nr:helix-turn-helix transcriptional regulator [Bacteroidales bacterium]
PDRTFLDKLASYVISNLDSGHLGVEDIASHMCLSSGQLNRRIKTITGFTTQNYVLRLRLEQARILLQGEPQSQIADIAYRCGFEDAASFSRAFKRVFDATPSQIRG